MYGHRVKDQGHSPPSKAESERISVLRTHRQQLLRGGKVWCLQQQEPDTDFFDSVAIRAMHLPVWWKQRVYCIGR